MVWRLPFGRATSARPIVWPSISGLALSGLTVTTSSTRLCHLEDTNSPDGAARWGTTHCSSTLKQRQSAPGWRSDPGIQQEDGGSCLPSSDFPSSPNDLLLH